ncbi:MAG: hypothetical protein ABFS23_04810 [Pseudomonadota bacterium]
MSGHGGYGGRRWSRVWWCSWPLLLLLPALQAAETDLRCPDRDALPAGDEDPALSWVRVDWPRAIADCLPPLAHARGTRWPLLLWESGPPEAWTAGRIASSAARGVVPGIRLKPEYLVLARELQRQGLPVIAIDARGWDSPWPYHLAGDADTWALRYPGLASVPEKWRHQPDPTRFTGWKISADRLRDALTAFKDAGITIDAVWLDYENQPAVLDFEAVLAADPASHGIPPKVLANRAVFERYRRTLWQQLISTYVAAPVRELYPAAAVTNWVTTLSTEDHPVLSWEGRPHPPVGGTLFTHTNPVAYGVDSAYARVSRELAGAEVPADWIFLYLLLQQVSADAANRQRHAPELGSLVWVARKVDHGPEKGVAQMSRSAYREALRHLWLRGVDGMAVFNPHGPGQMVHQLTEVMDAQAAYEELLTYGAFLDEGKVLNFAIPRADTPGILWSGRLLEDRAVIRTYNPTGQKKTLVLEPWPGMPVTLTLAPGGETRLLERIEETGRVAVERPRPFQGCVSSTRQRMLP